MSLVRPMGCLELGGKRKVGLADHPRLGSVSLQRQGAHRLALATGRSSYKQGPSELRVT
jgi:hypothetical protein